MIDKCIRAAYNVLKIGLIKLRCGKKVTIPFVQPMRIKSQLMIQSKVNSVVIGRHLKLETDAKIRVINGGSLNVGNNCFINCNSFITVLGKTTIGNNCMIGPGVMIFDHDHDYKALGGISSGKMISGEITIGDNVWIGANSVILKGTKIGDNCVIAAGCVISGTIPPYTMIYQKRESVQKKYHDRS